MVSNPCCSKKVLREREGERERAKSEVSTAESRKQFSKLRDCSSSWTCRDGWSYEQLVFANCSASQLATAADS